MSILKKIWLYSGIIAVIIVLVAVYISFVSVTQVEKGVAPSAPRDISTPPLATTTPIIEPKLFEYVEIQGGCNWKYVGSCVNMRSGPGTKYRVVARLRDGMVLNVGDAVTVDGQVWYKIIFASALRYPERVDGDLYIAQTDAVHVFTDVGDQFATHINASSTKRIVVDISEQMLYAYDGDSVFMKQKISTGLELTPTPRGTFYVYKKTPSRYMQGPLPGISDQYYDLPGVPWNLYFTNEGAVIHGAYWHDKFGQQWSHGCVNLPPDEAKALYMWADAGMTVIVKR